MNSDFIVMNRPRRKGGPVGRGEAPWGGSGPGDRGRAGSKGAASGADRSREQLM